MITLEQYLMGRDKLYPDEYAIVHVEDNAKFLLHQVNSLLISLGLEGQEVRSGWRPREINAREGGKEHSYHLVGRAIDISDPLGGLYTILETNPDKLRAHQLWMESKTATKSWVHLDNGWRKDRPSRIFLP